MSNTFYKISQQLIDAKKAKGLKAASIRNFIAFMNNHIYPYLKNVPVNKITTSIVIKTLEHLKKIENHRSVLIGCSRINEVINYGVNLGIAKYNPITNVSKVFTAPKTKHATTLKPDEFPLFLKTLENALICEQVKNAMKLQIQTMTRPTETLSAMWCEFNIKQKTWTIPAERMKMKKEHKIHLSKQAIAILNYCKQNLPASAYVFPSIRGSKNKPMSKKGVISAIKIIGYEGRIVPHGFRSAASTTLNEQGFNFDVIESALSHKDTNAVRRAYNHAEYDKHKKELFNWWGDYVEKALTKAR